MSIIFNGKKITKIIKNKVEGYIKNVSLNKHNELIVDNEDYFENIIIQGDLPKLVVNANDPIIDFSNSTGEIEIIDVKEEPHYYLAKNLTPENIAKGVEILGVTGIHENTMDAYLTNDIMDFVSYVTTIKQGAFYYNTKLRTVNLPNLLVINNEAFRYDWFLNTGRFASATTINNFAFGNCSRLTDLYFGANQVVELANVAAFSSAMTETGYCTIHVRPHYATDYGDAPNWSSLITEGKIKVIGDYYD